MRVERVDRAADVRAGAELFDSSPEPAATAQFFDQPGHHLLFAYDGSSRSGNSPRPLGFVSGVEMTHPDKGREMFVYELSVAPTARRRGVATALLQALAQLATDTGCHSMWVAVDAENSAALATYRYAGARADGGPALVLSWDLTRQT